MNINFHLLQFFSSFYLFHSKAADGGRETTGTQFESSRIGLPTEANQIL